VDIATGSMEYLSPRNVVVDLQKIGGHPKPRLMYLDAEQLKNITSISIRAPDSEGRLTLKLK
jgi:hypothetical protein